MKKDQIRRENSLLGGKKNPFFLRSIDAGRAPRTNHAKNPYGLLKGWGRVCRDGELGDTMAILTKFPSVKWFWVQFSLSKKVCFSVHFSDASFFSRSPLSFFIFLKMFLFHCGKSHIIYTILTIFNRTVQWHWSMFTYCATLTIILFPNFLPS